VHVWQRLFSRSEHRKVVENHQAELSQSAVTMAELSAPSGNERTNFVGSMLRFPSAPAFDGNPSGPTAKRYTHPPAQRLA
jgi:hypothetical protein